MLKFVKNSLNANLNSKFKSGASKIPAIYIFVISVCKFGPRQSLFQVQNGPSSALILKAHVTMPSMTISDSVLDFGQVLCSQCKIITVQFFNHKRVPCEWVVVSQSAESAKPNKERDDWSTTNQPWKIKKKKEKERRVVNVFEVIPSAGVLMPGQRYNVQIKFMPLQQVLIVTSVTKY